MKTQSKNTICETCGKEKKLTQYNEAHICTTCRNTVKLLKNNPDCIQQFLKVAQLSPNLIHTPPIEQELPEVLNAVRYRTTDRERNTWYVSVSELRNNPVEIFASTAFDRDQHLQSRISNLTTITRLISLILRHIFIGEQLTLEKTLRQIYRSSRQLNDLPDMLGKVLANYSKETDDKKKCVDP
jgi:hypothetical protein